MRCTIFRSRLSERAVHWARGSVLRMLGMRQVMRMRVLVRERVVSVRRVAVRKSRVLRRVARAQLARAAMVLRKRQRRARRPPVAALLHVRPRGASRCATTRAAPSARQRMPPRLVRAPIVALAARHPFRSLLPLPLASPPSGQPPAAHPLIRTTTTMHTRLFHSFTFQV